MPLWERYQQCLVTTDPTELVLIIDQFERAMLAGAEPPFWMRAWGPHVMSQPLRAAVAPQALGAACTLRAAAVMAEAEHLTEARALYQRVRARYHARTGAQDQPSRLSQDAARRETESDRDSSPPDVGLQDPPLNLLLAMPHSHRRTRDL